MPNATVMVIEGAERFGLAQLHQFRGRVGRGTHRSYCLLFSDTTDPGQNPRLKAIEDIHDGFGLAEADLELRGPGEFFGTRQSGMPDLHVANLSDLAVLSLARESAGPDSPRGPGPATAGASGAPRQAGELLGARRSRRVSRPCA